LQEDPRTGEVIWRNLVPKVDARLADVLEKMVRCYFTQRYQNAGEALQALLSLSPSPPPPPPPTPPPPPIISPNTTRRTFLEWAVLAGGGFVLAVISQNLLNNKSSSSSPNLPPPSDNEPPFPESSPQQESPKPPPETPAPKPSSNGLKTVQFETVTVNSTGQIASRNQGQAQVFTDNLGDGITIDMIAIPGGSFMMGSPSTEAGQSNDEGPQHNVNISPFFMGKYEVTNEQYQAVMGNNPSNFKGAKRPVEQVSWNDAVEFCRKLTQKTGKTYRLPSEAEWEYACRARTTTPFYFGETITPDLVNYNGNYPYGSAPKGLDRQQTTDVGSFPPNVFGLYDMHGNVWEWCSDKWHDNYNGAPTDGSSWETGGSEYRVRRGGSWYSGAVYCRGANRDYSSAVNRRRYLGFRVALVSA